MRLRCSHAGTSSTRSRAQGVEGFRVFFLGGYVGALGFRVESFFGVLGLRV